MKIKQFIFFNTFWYDKIFKTFSYNKVSIESEFQYDKVFKNLTKSDIDTQIIIK